MLALFAIFGALGAGYLADAIMNTQSADQDDDVDPTDEDSTEEGHIDAGSSDNLLDLISPDTAYLPEHGPQSSAETVVDGMPWSDDSALPLAEDLDLLGTDSDDILSGGDGGDFLSGAAGNDQLTGRGGNDRLSGGSGDDRLDGGVGADLHFGGAGQDQILGGAGDDGLWGDDDADELAGGAGQDTLDGGEGSDSLLGGEGDDSLLGQSGDDWLAGGIGHDALFAGEGADTLDGGAGNDTLDASGSLGEVDFLNGGAGDDTLVISAADQAHGGGGADIFQLSDIWLGDPVPAIIDYAAEDDQIVVLYDADFHPEPVLAIERADTGADATVTLDGVPIALVKNAPGLSVADIILHAA